MEDEKEAGKNRTPKPGGNADKECKVSEVEGGEERGDRTQKLGESANKEGKVSNEEAGGEAGNRTLEAGDDEENVCNQQNTRYEEAHGTELLHMQLRNKK